MTIDIPKLIKDLGLDLEAVAKELFPNNQYPNRALKRITDKKALLNTEQVSKLSEITGIAISGLFGESHWKMKTENNLLVLRHGEYIAVYDPSTGLTDLMDGEQQIGETQLLKTNIPLSEYISLINDQIKNFENAKDHN